jgi:hypothetical protein
LKKLLAILGFLAVIALGFFAQLWADDFCGLEMTKTLNPIDYALYFYKYWDGRVLGFAIQGLLQSNITIAQATIVLWSICFVLNVYFVFLILFQKNNELRKNIREYHWPMLLICAVLWIGFRRHISETVYWSTGGFYILTCLVSLIWLYYYEKVTLQNKKSIAAWSIFSLMVGMLSFLISPALITYISFPILYSVVKKEKSIRVLFDRKFLISFLFVTVGTLIIVAAPGNFLRAHVNPTAFQGNIFLNFLVVNRKFITHVWHMVPLLFLLILSTKSLWDKIKTNLSPFLRWRWLMTAISTAAPLAVLGGPVSPRAGIYFHTYAFIFFCYFFYYLIDRYRLWPKDRYQSYLQLLLVFGFLINIYYDLSKAIPFSRDYSAQVANLENVSGQPVDYEFVRKAEEPRSLKIGIRSQDKTQWANVCMSRYFNVNSVIFPQAPRPKVFGDDGIENHYLDTWKKYK